ncbi:hypothetical protein NA56DRAFT_340533 [Hyaloscypha hepaticicola]|uniref:Uncharacterized protein n=1 Tax=Hyaloscypha hepaticicola TaxID=2082293 RepID=A0A2J6QJ03_9HELO|nr:hypothetical protein NA56DRAFT_340533 [Hyaloscypha hepaticicola]
MSKFLPMCSLELHSHLRKRCRFAEDALLDRSRGYFDNGSNLRVQREVLFNERRGLVLYIKVSHLISHLVAVASFETPSRSNTIFFLQFAMLNPVLNKSLFKLFCLKALWSDSRNRFFSFLELALYILCPQSTLLLLDPSQIFYAVFDVEVLVFMRYLWCF